MICEDCGYIMAQVDLGVWECHNPNCRNYMQMGYTTKCKTCGEIVRRDSVDDLIVSKKLHRSQEGEDHRFGPRETEHTSTAPLKIDRHRPKKHQVELTDAEWEYLDEVRDLYEVRSRSEVLQIILSKEIDGFNHLLDEKDVGKAKTDDGGWAWLCRKHLEEAGRSNEITGRVPLFSNMEGYCCDVKDCSESSASYVSISSNFWNKEVEA
ncbi:MAG: hypothetical protein ACYDAZ_00615 [Thermoplasmataceae archaeon]